jgi:hypothetical protein
MFMSILSASILTGVLGAKLAYLDPGSGSYLIQILIAALLGSAFVIKSFWNQIKNFFITLFGGKKKEESQDEQPK